MIEITNTDVYGWEAAIRGMRNPMNSWDKSDSVFCDPIVCSACEYDCEHNNSVHWDDPDAQVCLGDNDYDLMKRLVYAGSEHSKFMRMINVTMDITAPLYWWKEFDTYKVGTVANSCSTMHKIQAKEFTIEDFSHEHLRNTDADNTSPGFLLKFTVEYLNQWRTRYLETKSKDDWWQMIQLLPSSYNQKRTIQLNYAVLHGMYHQRKNHKLDEWRSFCEWAKTLPYSELITK